MSQMRRGRPSPLNDHVSQIGEWIRRGFTYSDIAGMMKEYHGVKTSVDAIGKAVQRHKSLQQAREYADTQKILNSQASPEGVQQLNDDTIIITGKPNAPVEELLIEDILTRRNLEPDEWEVKQILDNQWEANAGKGSKITLYQFKIWLTRKTPIDLIFPAIPKIEGIKRPKGPKTGKPVLVVINGDQQAPWQDPDLHDAYLGWLEYNQPDIGVIHGDLLDLGFISQHRDDPAWDTPVQNGIQSGFEVLYDYRMAAPDMLMKLRKGNHDDRIRNEQLERAERMYGVTAAQWPGKESEEWVYSFNHLLHLRELEVEYVEPKGTYEFEQIPLSDYIAVRHGHLTGKDASIRTAEQAGHSIVLGHTHKQSILKQTLWNSITRSWRIVTAVEAGCMCRIVGGLGYANAGTPNWQPGFATIQIFPDGNFSAELATWSQEGILRWRDQEFTA